jgi:hypothetical protein
MTQDYRNLYRVQMLECARGGFCSSHVCAQGAKANPLSAVLPALARQPNFELRPLCNVEAQQDARQIVFGDDGQSVRLLQIESW